MQTEQATLTQIRPMATDAEVLEALQHQLTRAVTALEQGHGVHGQQAIEDVLGYTLLLMDRLNIQADRALQRVITRWRSEKDTKRLRVYPSFVEVWVGHEYRGGWPLQSAEDVAQVELIAAELNCQLEYANTQQLSLL
jgi:hypothetical protein